MKEEKFIAIIPCRYKSTRFDKKVLTLINGKTLIQRTYEQAIKSNKFKAVLIATDHIKIKDHVESFGAKAYLTSPNCKNGTDRIIEMLKKNSYLQKEKIIINIQADHPHILPTTIDTILNDLKKDEKSVISTAVIKTTSYKKANNFNSVKCVFNKNKHALYFSRHPIPYQKKSGYYYIHLGIYAYKTKFLLQQQNSSSSFLQKAEDLEQLKILEEGYKIKISIVKDKAISIDSKDDIKTYKKSLL